ncbi:MAG: hypothetical protein AUG51_22365 [Acidobacteria bacterium 13_1_20CM_3_53_8]|nr:MAG: hypothetical protein AUG51_22365 [Acidobacteria bacterium 13_1_20CM_3_53_8]
MTTDYYKKALEAARKELATLEDERAKLDKRITQLKQGIVGLSALAGNEDSGEKPQSMMDVLTGVGVETGLTDATRMIVSAFGMPMTPVQVRDALLNLGYDLSGYSNVVASLHTIMKRLGKNKELIALLDDNGKALGAYQWNPDKPLPRLRPNNYTRSIVENLASATDSPSATVRRSTVIDPFVGQGNVDFVLTNPPYATPKSGKPQRAKASSQRNRKIAEEAAKKAVEKFYKGKK